jgi:putative toxin-antitoxin system antitoxin component (TIGR02293 family)
MTPSIQTEDSTQKQAIPALLSGTESELRIYQSVLGVRSRSLQGIMNKVLEGLEFKTAERLRLRLGLNLAQFAETIQIAPRTFHRRRHAGQLNANESDRVLRLCRLFGRALELFEGQDDQAAQWLAQPQRALGNRAPLAIAKTDIGTRQIDDLIGRLEHGVFT